MSEQNGKTGYNGMKDVTSTWSLKQMSMFYKFLQSNFKFERPNIRTRQRLPGENSTATKCLRCAMFGIRRCRANTKMACNERRKMVPTPSKRHTKIGYIESSSMISTFFVACCDLQTWTGKTNCF